MRTKQRAKSRPVKPTSKPKQTRKTPILITILLCVIVILIIGATAYKVAEAIFAQHQSNNFPRLEISLANVTVEDIDTGSKDTKYPGNTAYFTIDGKASIFEDVEIKGRGNSTWIQAKKAYQITLPFKESLFNLKKGRKWILLANKLDASYLRNDTAFYIERSLNENFYMSGRFLDLYIDDYYRGLYYLSEKIEASKTRLNLKDDYGIIAELDNDHTAPENCTYTSSGNCIVTHDFVNNDNSEHTTKDFVEDINRLEQAVAEKDYDKISSLIDIDSFARYYLVSEFTANPDAYNSSFFLYKDGEKELIHAGPGWDFDLAFGNTVWTWIPEEIDPETFYSPFTDHPFKNYAIDSVNSGNNVSHTFIIVYSLLDFPEFQDRVKQIYQETLSDHGEELLSYIRSQAAYIRDAAYRDAKRWKLDTDFDEEVDYLVDWVSKRYNHFEELYGSSSIEDSMETPSTTETQSAQP